MRRPALALLTFVLFLGANHLLWAAWDGRPPGWDRAVHLENALRCARVLGHGPWRAMLTLSGYYPPLVYCAAGLLHRVLGSSPLVALAVIQGALALVVFATYWIGARLHSTTVGLGAGLLVGVYAEVLLESRHFMLDVPLTALVALTVLALLKAESFARPGWSLVAGGLAGLGLLAKWTYPIFILPVGLFLWVRGRRAPEMPARSSCLLGAVGVMVAVAAPWYLHHLSLAADLLKNAYAAGVAEGEPGLTSVAGWGYYLWGMVYQLGPPFALVFALGLAYGWRMPGRGLLLVWVAAPLALFTLLQNKDYRYTMPCLPAVALLSVAWLGRLGPRWAPRAVGVLALLAVAQASFLGWGWPVPAWARGRMDRALLFPSFPPLSEHWPIVEILRRVQSDRPVGERRVRLSVVPDHISFSRFNFSYEAALNELPVRVLKAWTGAPLFIDYAVTKEGEQGPVHTTGQARLVMARIQAGDPTLASLLQPLGEWPLPDGSRARLYRVAASPVSGITAQALTARLHELTADALAWVVREPRGVRVEVEPHSDAETLTGHFRRLVLRFDSARVGDFRRNDRAIRVRAVDLALEELRINPYALALRGELEVLDARRLSIRHAAVTEADLARALAETLPWLRAPAVRVRRGGVEIEGGLRGIRALITIVPDLGSADDGALALWAERVRLGPLPVPAALVNLGLTQLNPVIRLGREPVAIEARRVMLDDGTLRIASP